MSKSVALSTEVVTVRKMDGGVMDNHPGDLF